MNSALIALLGVVLVAWVWHRGMRPAPNRVESPDELARALRYLLNRGIRGGTLRFQVESDASRAVVFTKYIRGPGDVGCRGRCRQGAEPAERLAAFRQDIVGRHIQASFSAEGPDTVVDLECGTDVGLGVMFVVLAFQRLFNVKLSTHCVAFFERVAIANAPAITGVDETLS